MLKTNKKGIALFMVLATILIVVILSNVILTIISSQSRLTHHEISRIRAYYAAQAGLIYAMEMLRNGRWAFSSGSDRYYCMALVSGGSGVCIDAVTLTDTIPYDLGITNEGTLKVQVRIHANPNHPALPPNGIIQLDAKTDYTYGNP
ncbi:MAG: hypothetical protein M0R66_06240 [Candidatus Omnitrophica bacterium]|nr:hypothetical protein [Candidatus Omnitrophota bacterium]